ncbi:di-trans,poly-cis-decaprenylcistransferase [Candidatus Micrarchaeota archaeon]|nr:di-trans,poly-cis-decaprenylcistransferase [Candidatus Micrarchaeota archaeon]
MIKHLAIIPDGNRRWAQINKVSLMEGYAKGIEKIGQLLGWCKELNIETLTLWGFSTENFQREQKEVSSLMKLFEIKFREALTSKEIHENQIRVKILGRKDLLTSKAQEFIQKLEEETSKYDKHNLNLLLCYGGRQEIVDACNAIIEECKKGKLTKVDESTFQKYLYTNGMSDPDLIIRTSGEKRLSGLMPWQSSYSELYFSDKFWPDFKKEDLVQALTEYENRKRRFGR